MDLQNHPRKATFYHEAGHAVIGLLLGFRCDCIRVLDRRLENGNVEKGAAAIGANKESPCPNWTSAQMEVAGYCAELKACGNAWTSLSGSTGDLDNFATTLDASQPGAAGISPRERAAFVMGAASATVSTTLEQAEVWRAVEDVAESLMERFDNAVEFMPHGELLPIVQRHLTLDAFVCSRPEGDPCAP